MSIWRLFRKKKKPLRTRAEKANFLVKNYGIAFVRMHVNELRKSTWEFETPKENAIVVARNFNEVLLALKKPESTLWRSIHRSIGDWLEVEMKLTYIFSGTSGLSQEHKEVVENVTKYLCTYRIPETSLPRFLHKEEYAP